MNVGMLWFDKDKQAGMADRVGKAAEFYKKKYKKQPNICYVHPKMLEEEKLQIDKVMVKPSLSIQPNYFWIGVRRKIRGRRDLSKGI